MNGILMSWSVTSKEGESIISTHSIHVPISVHLHFEYTCIFSLQIYVYMMLLFLAFFLSPDFETDFIFFNNIKLLNLLMPGFCCCNNSVNYCRFQVDLCVVTMNQELYNLVRNIFIFCKESHVL